MIGANFAIILVGLHFAKAVFLQKILSPEKWIIFVSGAAIFLISLGSAFSGYVLVSGNMSFWACFVILNLLTVIPILGLEIVSGILGNDAIGNWAIRRFGILHFLLVLLAIVGILTHIFALHRQNPAQNSNSKTDGSQNLTLILAKDLALALFPVLFSFSALGFGLIHPDNWQHFSRFSTPAHIEPEIYFLWTFSAIKLHNGKILGALFHEFLASTFSAARFSQQFPQSNLSTSFRPFSCKSEFLFLRFLDKFFLNLTDYFTLFFFPIFSQLFHNFRDF